MSVGENPSRWVFVLSLALVVPGGITNAALCPADYVSAGWRDCG